MKDVVVTKVVVLLLLALTRMIAVENTFPINPSTSISSDYLHRGAAQTKSDTQK